MKIIWTWLISIIVLRITKEMGYCSEIFEQYQIELLGSILILGIIIQLLCKSECELPKCEKMFECGVSPKLDFDYRTIGILFLITIFWYHVISMWFWPENITYLPEFILDLNFIFSIIGVLPICLFLTLSASCVIDIREIIYKNNSSLQLNDENIYSSSLILMYVLICIISLVYICFYDVYAVKVLGIGILSFIGFFNRLALLPESNYDSIDETDEPQYYDEPQNSGDSFGKGIAWAFGAQKAHEVGHNGLLGAYVAGKTYDVATGKTSIKDVKPGPVMSTILALTAVEEYKNLKSK